MANIITFRNFTQKCLWDNEISGQLSDGKWENSGVDRIFWTAETKVGTPGVSFKTWKRANFNFASSELIDIVGDRMLMTAKASKVTTNEKIISAAEYLEGIESQEEFDKINDYREKYLKSFIKTWKVAEKIINANYTKSNLIADLKDMSRTVSLAGNTPTTSTNGNIPSKDMDRAKSIIDKAKGDEGKEIQYTTAMANATGDKSKLQFRGDAMTKLGKEKLAKIFYDKLNETKTLRENKINSLNDLDKSKFYIVQPCIYQYTEGITGQDKWLEIYVKGYDSKKDAKVDLKKKTKKTKITKKTEYFRLGYFYGNSEIVSFDELENLLSNKFDIYSKNFIQESKSIKVSDLIKLIESKTGKKIVLENKLRTVKVEFQNGDSLTTNMAAHLTDDEINNYYKPGKLFNLGVGGKDKMVKVKKAIILENKNTYFNSYSSATNHVYDEVSKKYKIDDDDWFRKVSVGGKPKTGDTKRSDGITLYDLQTEKEQRKALHIQVYRMNDNRFELNFYIN